MRVSLCGFKSHLPHNKKEYQFSLQLILLFNLLVQSFYVSPFKTILLIFLLIIYVFGGPSSSCFIFSVFFLFCSFLTVIITLYFYLSIHFSKIISNYLTFCTLYCRQVISPLSFGYFYSTVTTFARFLGLSTSNPLSDDT